MPTATNLSGDIFGGWLMSQMDLAAASVAVMRASGRCSTVAVNSLRFLRPVLLGDEVSLYAELSKVGRTSLIVQVQGWRRCLRDRESEHVTSGEFVFVAIDENRHPRTVPAEFPQDSAAPR